MLGNNDDITDASHDVKLDVLNGQVTINSENPLQNIQVLTFNGAAIYEQQIDNQNQIQLDASIFSVPTVLRYQLSTGAQGILKNPVLN